MQNLDQTNVVALDATELQQLQGGNTPPTGVWIGENGEGCIPSPFPGWPPFIVQFPR